MRGKAKVHKVMSEFKEGTLKSSSGGKVTKRKQAIAIALSEAGMSKRMPFQTGNDDDRWMKDSRKRNPMRKKGKK